MGDGGLALGAALSIWRDVSGRRPEAFTDFRLGTDHGDHGRHDGNQQALEDPGDNHASDQTVGVDGNIAGYTLSQVRPSSVLLHPKEGADVELKLGAPLRLDGAPPVDGPSTTATESDKPADSGTPAASGDAAEILRKLMQKREQESK
jgi:hypothetical protein